MCWHRLAIIPVLGEAETSRMMGFEGQLLASRRSVRDSETLHQNVWWTASEQQWEIDLCAHTCVCATPPHTHTQV